MERGIPVLTYASIANAGGAWVFFLRMPITWAMIVFRPEEMDPNFVRIMNDYVWFIFILSWPPFAFFMIFIAVAIFRDHNVPTIYPRWVAFFNLWCAGADQPRGADRVRQDRAVRLRRTLRGASRWMRVVAESWVVACCVADRPLSRRR